LATPKQIRQIATSIEEFGFVGPVLVGASDGAMVGRG
jgi:ParB-like chromosome segregation protein Spo0J